MRILVTNDDGIDSVGLHVLAKAMREHGDVVVVAPDSEYSGAGASLGPLHLIRPDVHKANLEGIDQAWTVAGPPALCVMFARLGAFDGPVDLVVSGINPGANVGRAVYHSGTVGAALTARNGGINGVAVSQAVTFGSIEGQAIEDVLGNQQWETAATVASEVVRGLVADLPTAPIVANINVPNCAVDEIKGWLRADVGQRPVRAMEQIELVPAPGHENTYRVEMTWGEPNDNEPDQNDVGAVQHGYVALTWLTKLESMDPGASITEAESALESFLASAGRVPLPSEESP